MEVEKTNITFHKNNTVSYYQKKTWFYDNNRSKGSLKDKITQLNTIAVVSYQKLLMAKFYLNK